MPQRIVLGIGTGRSGSLSLARLLDRQPGACFTHELGRPDEAGRDRAVAEPLPWTSDPSVGRRHLEMIRGYPGQIVGDVSSSWLPYLDALLAEDPRLRVVCLTRDRAQVVESFMRKTGRKHHWVGHDGTRWSKDPRWDPCFPDLDPSLTKREAIAAYWDMYQEEVQRLHDRYQDQVRVWGYREALNTSAGLDRLLDFVGIPARQRVPWRLEENVSRRWWVPEDAPGWRKLAGKALAQSAAMPARIDRILGIVRGKVR